MSKADEMRERLNRKAEARAKLNKKGRTGPLAVKAESAETSFK